MGSSELDDLLSQWEETYKKGLLSFWLLLLLSQRKAYPYEIKAAITEMSCSTINADENSIYRLLNRLADSGIVDSELLASESGPSRRYYYLTSLGRELLTRFIARNILVFEQPAVADLIQNTMNFKGKSKG